MHSRSNPDLFLATREFEIQVAAPLRPNQIVTRYNPAPRAPHSPEEIASINRTWQERLLECQKASVPLFDGSLFRLQSHNLQNEILTLDVGITGYKEYVGTRTPSYSCTHARDELANPLAVCAVVLTSDAKILIEKRAGTDVYAGRYHVIGGYADRDKDFHASQFNPFEAIAREVNEETGLALSPDSFLCSGLAYDVLTPHPELCFVAHAPHSHQVADAHKNSDGEIRTLEFLDDSPDSLENFLRQHHTQVSATGEAALLLHGLHSYGPAWFAAATAFMR
jgi:8-oxo-dGTP pyrophosphatase MutT (NUDIX family)